ncbi:UNVERIFIED_CONTAM: hypothetical protein K2H54_065245 [Gekko kuhli]
MLPSPGPGGLLLLLLPLLLAGAGREAPFDELYAAGVEAHSRGDFAGAVRCLERALGAHRRLRETRLACGLRCRREAPLGPPAAPFAAAALRRARCLRACRGPDALHAAGEEVRADFQRRLPYSYLQRAYIQQRYASKVYRTRAGGEVAAACAKWLVKRHVVVPVPPRHSVQGPRSPDPSDLAGGKKAAFQDLKARGGNLVRSVLLGSCSAAGKNSIGCRSNLNRHTECGGAGNCRPGRSLGLTVGSIAAGFLRAVFLLLCSVSSELLGPTPTPGVSCFAGKTLWGRGSLDGAMPEPV